MIYCACHNNDRAGMVKPTHLRQYISVKNFGPSSSGVLQIWWPSHRKVYSLQRNKTVGLGKELKKKDK
jgi:hypothetical protein